MAPFYNFKSSYFVAILLLSTLRLAAQSTAARPAAIEASINELMQKYEAVGLSVAVVKKREVIYSRAFGQKDIERKEPLTTQSIFRIASISKSFSATSIMQLVEAGKLRLDDDVSNLIGFKVRNPHYPEEVITLKMLLSHTSSLNDSQGYFQLDVINPQTNPNAAKCYSANQPGSTYDYCNLNFNIIGTVIERVSGERFDRYVYHHILQPLGLYGGYCVDSLDQTRFATLYEYNKDTREMTPSPMAYNPRREEIRNYVMGYSAPIFSPTGGMKISAEDLARYMAMHMQYGRSQGTKIMSRKSAKRMQTPVAKAERYGLALWTSDKLIPGVTLKGHTGSAYGLYSLMAFDPKKKYGFVAITNGCNPIASHGYNELLASTLRVLYEGLIE
ncbi:CubicO group peptidase (beta-lactamase class C family) [Rhabdobacter roseus]|uniref:CubicO group peptidase (Beta-lactamase class C family) n=1 Tax=Rhabdobacter roseus TaxID=1655419 RepID=A0A840TU92_9BACT|nr:serine hydrolase domain-containing protein [Rhabdobacter roseus]MBB5286475.1 CubicO group peptidase (beta-lactamase class C family) [Rhabdobacter roseus]